MHPSTRSFPRRSPWPARRGRLAAALMALLLALGGHSTAAAAPASAVGTTDPAVTRLQADLETLAAQVPGELGLVLLDPDGAEVVARNPDRSFTSASLYKLFLAHAVLDRVDRGQIALTDTVPGTTFTVREAVERMITWSDNVSGAALGRWLGWREVQAFAQGQGFESTTYDPDTGEAGTVAMTTTPDDVADLLDRLRSGELLAAPSSTLLLGFLADQELEYALSTGLSPDVEFAHKTGLLLQVSHDAGLVRLNGKEYVVAVLTDGWSGYDDARPWFRTAGQAIDAYVHASSAA
jgi:beta-lactamase class A